MATETTEQETAGAKVGLSSAKRAFERIVIRLENVRPHMTITWAFTRFHVADAIAKMHGGKRADYDGAASRILAKARKDGTVKPARKNRDRYYYFADV